VRADEGRRSSDCERFERFERFKTSKTFTSVYPSEDAVAIAGGKKISQILKRLPALLSSETGDRQGRRICPGRRATM